MKPVLFLLSSVAALLVSLDCVSQKLPETQQKPVWVQSPVRVDGKPDSSLSSFGAYNKNTGLYYTIGNDDKNLYLLVKSGDQTIANKIMMGGITFSINTEGKKKIKDAYSITFPVISPPQRGQRRQGSGGFAGVGQSGERRQRPDSAAVAELRKQQLAGLKEIGVTGFKQISDSLISIYNEYGIKAAATYDKEGNYLYELAVPFKEIGLSLDQVKELTYNIRVNGRQFAMAGRMGDGGDVGRRGGVVVGFGGGMGVGLGGGFGGGMRGGASRGFDPAMFDPTDFWAKYVPVKK